MADEAQHEHDSAPPVDDTLTEARSAPPSVLQERNRQSHRTLLLVVRLLFMVLLVSVTLLTVGSVSKSNPEEFETTTAIGLFLASVAVGALVLLVDAVTPHKRLASMVGVYLGVCVGLIGALAVGSLLDVVTDAWGLKDGKFETYLGLAKVLVAIVLCYLAVSFVLTTKDDFRLVIPYVEFAKQVRGVRPMLLDTSVLIDGRIDSLGHTGFLDAPVVVPQFVLEELQKLADSSDKLKRARGRRGLDLVGRLQQNPFVDISIDDSKPTGHSVDQLLLELARTQNLRVLTTDYNLQKVAKIRGVTVVNLNDLANSIKAQALPGEAMDVEVIKTGEGANQGVGYMPDGTMVVIDGAADKVGQVVQAVVTNTLQTSAGRMIFARTADALENGGTHVSQMASAATNQPRATAPPPPRPSQSPSAPLRPDAARRNPRR